MTESTTTAIRLFAALNERGVRYCHYKSNAHLVEGLQGLTDLDVLFDEAQAELISEILAAHGFRRFPAHPSRGYSGLEDFFAVNEETGRLLHLQVYYRLIVGERFFKNYRLPWENEFLETRIPDQVTGVYVADPALEWLLLICRAALKIRWRDRLLSRVDRHPSEFRHMLAENAWLAVRADAAAPSGLAGRLLGDRAGELVARAVAGNLRFLDLTRLRRELLGNPSVLRGYGPLPAVGLRWGRELRWMAGGVNRRYLHRPFPYARSSPSGGAVIAVVGSDGAGKSSVVRTLQTWLSGKVDVIPIYFGSGQGRSSLLRWPMKLALVHVRSRSGPSHLDPQERREREITIPRAMWALTLAREKRSKLRMVKRARDRGFVVVCDRYPQTQVGGVNDGPILWRWKESESSVKRAAASWEEGIYRMAADVAPDFVVRLLVTPETAMTRRPDDDPSELTFRTQLVRDLRFGNATHDVIDIDANRDLDSVTLEVKQRLWPGL